jgi:hypothetical protein
MGRDVDQAPRAFAQEAGQAVAQMPRAFDENGDKARIWANAQAWLAAQAEEHEAAKKALGEAAERVSLSGQRLGDARVNERRAAQELERAVYRTRDL